MTPEGNFILKHEDIMQGNQGNPHTCAIALMLKKAAYDTIENVYVDKDHIEYDCQKHEFSKENGLLLSGLIWKIDHPQLIISKLNTITNERHIIFSKEEQAAPPYEIHEYAHNFDVIIPEEDNHHKDFWEPHMIANEYDEYIEMQFLYSPFELRNEHEERCQAIKEKEYND